MKSDLIKRFLIIGFGITLSFTLISHVLRIILVASGLNAIGIVITLLFVIIIFIYVFGYLFAYPGYIAFIMTKKKEKLNKIMKTALLLTISIFSIDFLVTFIQAVITGIKFGKGSILVFSPMFTGFLSGLLGFSSSSNISTLFAYLLSVLIILISTTISVYIGKSFSESK